MLRLFSLFTFYWLICTNSVAAPLSVPAPLQEWQGWVLHNHPDFHCPFQHNQNSRTCEWSSGLKLNLHKQGGEFDYTVETFAEGWVTLPGDPDYWPQDVRDFANAIPVIENNQKPRVFLNPGAHRITGRFSWPDLPRTLAVPPRAGLLQLNLNNVTVQHPTYESSSVIWLANSSNQPAVAERDTLDIKVFRRIFDANPAVIETQLLLDVGGQERELTTGPANFPGFILRRFESDLPARIENDGAIRLQLKPGQWRIRLFSHSHAPLQELHFKGQNSYWPTHEIWAFETSPSLRSVKVSGLSSIDPSQTQMPNEWRNLPTYLAEPNSTLTIQELQRGDTTPHFNQLNLNKTVWLDFSGKQFTVHDQISGQFQQARLEVSPHYKLGRANQGEQPLLITQLDKSESAGVEIREPNSILTAVSTLPRDGLNTIPTGGWMTPFNELSEVLILPPGWSLLHATDADYVYGSWVSKWNLWHIFIFLMIVVSLGRSFNWKIGLVAMITLILTYHRSAAPLFIWLNFAALFALKPYVKNTFATWLQRYAVVCFAVCALLILPFLTAQMRLALYPQLEHNNVLAYSPETEHQAAKPKAVLAREQAPMAISDSSIEEIVVTGVRASRDDEETQVSAFASGPARQEAKSYIKTPYDAGQKIQVGPGLPNWSWNQITLRWSGPVTTEEHHSLYLVSPVFNRMGYFLSGLLPIVLLGLIAFTFYRHSLPNLRQQVKLLALGVLPLLFAAAGFISAPEHAYAHDTISEELLEELENRLIQEPNCLPDCAAIESVNIAINDQAITITLRVHSQLDMAFPIPSRVGHWLPSEVNVNQQRAAWLQKRGEQLFVRLQPGQHTVQLVGNIENQEQLQLRFLSDLHNVTAQLSGWDINGLPLPNQTSQTLQLQRTVKTSLKAEQKLLPDPIAPFVTIHRTIDLGLDWRITTTVERIAPSSGSIHLSIPLLPNESPSSGNVDGNGHMQVALDNQQASVSWQSTLPIADRIELLASQSSTWSESWTLLASTLWHTNVSGVAPIASSGQTSAWQWLPWPNERVSIEVTRPKAVPGNQISIDSATLQQTAGKRAEDYSITMSVRASQGTELPIPLPETSQFKRLLINGIETPVSPTNNRIQIPVAPGNHQIQIDWQEEKALTTRVQSPALDLGMPASNIRLQMQLPRDRWLIYVNGPSIGPAILFWGIFAVILVLAIMLGRSNLTPLKAYQWVLLSLGVATIELYALAFIAAWFIVITFRGKKTTPPESTQFNILQLLLFGFSIACLLALLASVPAALLSNPDMMVTGNGSYATSLNWYHDQTSQILPTAEAVTLPILSYRIAMLAWSIWLAFALMRWIPWAWQQLGVLGYWYHLPSKTNAKKAMAEDKPTESKEGDI